MIPYWMRSHAYPPPPPPSNVSPCPALNAGREILIQLLGVRAKLELEVKDLAERVAADGDEQERLGEELKTLETSIAARTKDLETEAGPAYDKARARWVGGWMGVLLWICWFLVGEGPKRRVELLPGERSKVGDVRCPCCFPSTAVLC